MRNFFRNLAIRIKRIPAKFKPHRREKRRRGFEFTKNSAIYLVIFVASLIFTQALRSHLSSIIFVFIVLLPIAMLIYVLLSRAWLSVYKVSEPATVEKLADYTYEFKMINNGILPYPFIDAVMQLPQANCVRTSERIVRLSMPALREYTARNTVKFRFRGTYEIGVSCFYVYDLFRLFRMRIDFGDYDTVYVMPRKLYSGDVNARAASDEADRTQKSAASYDRVEISDIRDYRSGDSLKSIHWKLSSKSEEFLVRDYDSGSARRTYIFADMSARYPMTPPEKKYDAGGRQIPATTEASELADDIFYEDMNEFCADGVCELTVATVLRELRAGNTVSLFWFDRRSEHGVCGYTVRGMDDFDVAFRDYATSPIAPTEKSLRKLSSMVRDTQNIKLLFVTSALDTEAIADYTAIADTKDGASSGSGEIILYCPYERYKFQSERRVYVAGCAADLASHGMKLTVGELSGRLPEGGESREK